MNFKATVCVSLSLFVSASVFAMPTAGVSGGGAEKEQVAPELRFNQLQQIQKVAEHLRKRMDGGHPGLLITEEIKQNEPEDLIEDYSDYLQQVQFTKNFYRDVIERLESFGISSEQRLILQKAFDQYSAQIDISQRQYNNLIIALSPMDRQWKAADEAYMKGDVNGGQSHAMVSGVGAIASAIGGAAVKGYQGFMGYERKLLSSKKYMDDVLEMVIQSTGKTL